MINFTMHNDLMEKLKDIIVLLNNYNVYADSSIAFDEVLQNFTSWQGYFDNKSGLFFASVFSELSRIGKSKIIIAADWWFDCELDWQWETYLGFTERIQIKNDEELIDTLVVVSGDKSENISYPGYDLSKQYRFGIAINALNRFLERQHFGEKLVEICDTGEDFSAYVVMSRSRERAFRDELKHYINSKFITNFQASL